MLAPDGTIVNAVYSSRVCGETAEGWPSAGCATVPTCPAQERIAMRWPMDSRSPGFAIMPESRGSVAPRRDGATGPPGNRRVCPPHDGGASPHGLWGETAASVDDVPRGPRYPGHGVGQSHRNPCECDCWCDRKLPATVGTADRRRPPTSDRGDPLERRNGWC